MTLLLALAACGGAQNDGGGGTTSGTPTSSDTTTPHGNGGNDESVPSVPWGPDDPPIPGQYAALAVSSADDLECEAIEQEAPESDFWTTVGGVCRALKGDADWPTSGSLDPPPGENRYQDCLNGELAAMIAALFEWRDEHPGAEPKVSYPSRSARSPCQLHVYEASVLPPDGSYPTPGVVVRLHVADIVGDDPPEVLVDGEPVVIWEGFSERDDLLLAGEVFIPAPIEAHEATIVVKTGFGDATGTVTLPEVPSGGVSGSPTASPTPS